MNIRNIHKKGMIIFFLLLTLLPGCSARGITVGDKIEIYQLIIHRIFSKDNSFGKAVDIHYIYINKSTNDNVGDREITKQPSQEIPKEIMDGIATKLTDLLVKVIWINNSNDVLKGIPGATVEDGAIITLGNLRFEKDIKVYVSIDIYFAGLAAAGRTYILKKDNNSWNITGDTGVFWVS